MIDTIGKPLWSLISERAELTPGRQMARAVSGRTMTFGSYRDACERAAAGLASTYGVGEGTRVSWILPSRFEAVVLAGALSRLDAVQNPILPIYRQREVGFITRQERRRFFTGAVRRAVEVRDRCCTFPGCDEPVHRGDVDHIIEYAKGGPTTQDNGRLYCRYHNNQRNRRPDLEPQ